MAEPAGADGAGAGNFAAAVNGAAAENGTAAVGEDLSRFLDKAGLVRFCAPLANYGVVNLKSLFVSEAQLPELYEPNGKKLFSVRS